MNDLLNQELLAEPVSESELSELLARLSATEALFKEPVPTIRDVAEATDASPLLIGRILRELRGDTESELLQKRMSAFESRLARLETKSEIQDHDLQSVRAVLQNSGTSNFQPLKDEPARWSEVQKWFGVADAVATESTTESANYQIEEIDKGKIAALIVFLSIFGFVLFIVIAIAFFFFSSGPGHGSSFGSGSVRRNF